MPDTPSHFDAPPDAFGYGRYSICIHAPSEIAAVVQAFRERSGMADFTTEPHISVIPGPRNLKDLDALKALVERVAAANAPPTARFKTPAFTSGEYVGSFAVEVTPDLVAVRDALIAALEAEFGVEPGNRPYWPKALTTKTPRHEGIQGEETRKPDLTVKRRNTAKAPKPAGDMWTVRPN